jgi:hypothetical protein
MRTTHFSRWPIIARLLIPAALTFDSAGICKLALA